MNESTYEAEAQLELKCFPFELKATGANHEFEGYVSVFNNIDSTNDIVDKNSFNTDLPDFLANGFIGGLNHNWDEPIGVPIEAKPDNKGLYLKARLSETQHGRDVYTLLKDRVIKKLSIGYQTLGRKYLEDSNEVMNYWNEVGYTPTPTDIARSQFGARVLTRIKLFEGSPVTVPANELATIQGVKKLAFEAAEKAICSANNLPLALPEMHWDKDEANNLLRKWAAAEAEPNAKYRLAFLWFDESNPTDYNSYKFQFAQPVGESLKAVPKAIYAIASAIQSSVVFPGISDDDRAIIRKRLNSYYARMRMEFNDSGIIPPWEQPKSFLPHKDEREFEECLRELGYSKSRATIIALHGFKAALREAEVTPEAGGTQTVTPSSVPQVDPVVPVPSSVAVGKDSLKSIKLPIDISNTASNVAPTSNDNNVLEPVLTPEPVVVVTDPPSTISIGGVELPLKDPGVKEFVSPTVLKLRQHVMGQFYDRFQRDGTRFERDKAE